MSGISTKDINKLRALQASGLTTDEIVDRSGWTEDKLSKVREELFAREEMDLVGRRTEDVFIDYVMRTRANIRQLDDILEDLRMTKQGSAMVGAVKAKQDLMDRILMSQSLLISLPTSRYRIRRSISFQFLLALTVEALVLILDFC